MHFLNFKLLDLIHHGQYFICHDSIYIKVIQIYVNMLLQFKACACVEFMPKCMIWECSSTAKKSDEAKSSQKFNQV